MILLGYCNAICHPCLLQGNDLMYNERFSLIVELLKEHNNVGIRTMSSTALV